MEKKPNIVKTIEALDKAQKEIAKKRVEAIRKLDLETDEALRSHMLVLSGFQQDMDELFTKIDEYIKRNKLASTRTPKEPSGTPVAKLRIKKTTQGVRGRAKDLPQPGSKLHGKYKNREYWGDITEDGVKIEGFDVVFPSMSAAAAAVTGKKTISGWTFWKVISTK